MVTKSKTPETTIHPLLSLCPSVGYGSRPKTTDFSKPCHFLPFCATHSTPAVDADQDAASGRVAWGPRGPGFKSRRPDQTFQTVRALTAVEIAVLESKWTPRRCVAT